MFTQMAEDCTLANNQNSEVLRGGRVDFHGSHGTLQGGKRSEKTNTPAATKVTDRTFLNYSAVAKGIHSAEVRSLGPYGLTRDDIRQIIPDRTLDRRIADGHNLKIEEADGIARLLRVVAFARRVFEDEALADEWLRLPNPVLNGLVPMHMARTDLGGREVEAVLGRIEHGVFG